MATRNPRCSLNDVVAVEKYSHLPAVSLPASRPIVLNSATEINNVIRGILDDVPVSGHIVVGFDSEWNIDTSAMGNVVARGPPAVIQIAYMEKIYVLQIGEMLSRKQLPHELLNFLQNNRVIKAGRLVNGDLRQLAMAAGQDSSAFQGGLDLATFAKQRLLITNAQISLADLAAKILGLCLPKNQTERISSNWSDEDLTESQVLYAARDAYVSLCIYNKILEAPQPQPFPDSTPNTLVGLPVIILTEDSKKVAARGKISDRSCSSSVDDINITPSRIVVTVYEVLIPATIISQHKKQPLKAMGPVPFDVVTLRSRVRILPEASKPIIEPQSNQCAEPTQATTALGSHSQPSSVEASVKLSPLDIADDEASDGTPLGEIFRAVDAEGSTDSESDVSVSNNPLCNDAESASIGKETLGPRALDPSTFKNIIRSRVVKDARIEAWLKTKNLKWDDVLKYKSNWLWRHCRRTIPPPEVLYPLVHEVFQTWGPLKDASSYLPLFTPALWKQAKNILELIRNGFLSDPPGVSLYYVIGFDKNAGGLPIYRCVRGTNSVEGGVHTHLRAMLPSCGASVRHMIMCLLDFILRHNLLVGTFNSTGKKYSGHDSIWLLNEIQELEITLASAYPSTSPISLPWVNGDLYEKTKEEMGISPVPEHIRLAAGMREFVEQTDGKQKQADLARMQNTSRPILPVHTVAEKKLFSRFMRELEEFRTSHSSITMDAVKIWNRYAETEKDVYYKLEEHLTAHFNGNWKETANLKQSVCETVAKTEPLQKRLRNPERTHELTNASAAEMSLHRITQGFRPMSMPHSPNGEAPLANESTSRTGSATVAIDGLDPMAARATVALSKKRVIDEQFQAAVKRARRIRTCPRCDHEECKGRQSWYRCENACRDCGRRSVVECVGRSSGGRNTRRCIPAASVELNSFAATFIRNLSTNGQIRAPKEHVMMFR
ncbi:hypothetical protein H0H87_004552 [Tephrocybe sp. NHM501043]|nr:hypothetical protein H0H87_004552 [Tephrocybe sp. NHM501043]